MVYEASNEADFNAQLESAGSKLVMVDFYATWCGPCKVIAPKIEKMSQEFKDVVFMKVDVDKNEDIAKAYKINSMPTFIFIKNKEKIGETKGANEGKVRSMINKLK